MFIYICIDHPNAFVCDVLSPSEFLMAEGKEVDVPQSQPAVFDDVCDLKRTHLVDDVIDLLFTQIKNLYCQCISKFR
jgi:hypothetical protein